MTLVGDAELWSLVIEKPRFLMKLGDSDEDVRASLLASSVGKGVPGEVEGGGELLLKRAFILFEMLLVLVG